MPTGSPTFGGWTCVAAGGVLVGAGAALRIPELLQVGVALLGVVLVQLARLNLRRPGYAVRRSVHPPAGTAGAPVAVEVTVTSARSRPEHLLHTDPVPLALGGVRRLPLVCGPGTTTLRYEVVPARRGRYVIPPGHLTWTDPFGVIRSAEAATAPTELVVYPRVEPLRGRSPAGTRNPGSST
ncbi:MAG: hypothetical protein ACRDJO_00390, partial [Actinomycetota bacterium]